jgi:hypothetical protein
VWIYPHSANKFAPIADELVSCAFLGDAVCAAIELQLLSIIVFFNLSQPLAGILSASGFAINRFF